MAEVIKGHNNNTKDGHGGRDTKSHHAAHSAYENPLPTDPDLLHRILLTHARNCRCTDDIPWEPGGQTLVLTTIRSILPVDVNEAGL